MKDSQTQLGYEVLSPPPHITTLEEANGVVTLTIPPPPRWQLLLILIGTSLLTALIWGGAGVSVFFYFEMRATLTNMHIPPPELDFSNITAWLLANVELAICPVAVFFSYRLYRKPPMPKRLTIRAGEIFMEKCGRRRFWKLDQIKRLRLVRQRDIFPSRDAYILHIEIRKRYPIQLPLKTRDPNLPLRLKDALTTLGFPVETNKKFNSTPSPT